MKIVILSESFLKNKHLDRLRKIGEVEVFENTNSEDLAISRLRGAEIAITDCFVTPMSNSFFERLTSVKYICINSTGFDPIDINGAEKKGILISNVPDYSSEAVAELAISLMFTTLRRIVELDSLVRDGVFGLDINGKTIQKYHSFNIKNKTFGIIGLGKIGEHAANLANGLGMNVIAFNRSQKKVPNVKLVTLTELLKESDIISIHTPLNDDTRGLIAMSDVIPNGRTFQQEFQENTISENDMLELGTTVGRVHTKLGPYQQPIRDNGDQVNYLKDLTHRFGYQNHPIINEVISELEKNPSQLILADLSPKNIGRGSHRQITICDFDSFFLGNPLYPLAFLTGHVLVHSLDSSRKSEALVYALLSGLKQEFPNGDYDSDLYIKTTLSSVLYRLRNPKINYPVPLSEQERLQKATTGFQLLFKNSISWEDVFREMTVWV